MRVAILLLVEFVVFNKDASVLVRDIVSYGFVVSERIEFVGAAGTFVLILIIVALSVFVGSFLGLLGNLGLFGDLGLLGNLGLLVGLINRR